MQDGPLPSPNDAPKSSANSFSSAKKVLRAMRISRALHLRGLGFTHAEIGDEEGYGESTACRLVKEGMACLTGRPAKELLAAELSFINALKEAVVNKKLDLRQVDRLIRLHERTSKLLGLEAPTRSRSRCSSG